MRNKEILKLVIGFRRFREKFFEHNNPLFEKLTQGQSPKTLIIACSDSRVDPALMSGANPGDLFVVRNVANLVPPYDSSGQGVHGVSAAIEFAVTGLHVENIVILGHRQCGGIRALVTGTPENKASFVGRWMRIAEPAKQWVNENYPQASDDEKCQHCEMQSITVSIQNLKSFPFVVEAIEKRNLNILGVYFDLEKGQLLEYDESAQQFSPILA